MVCNPINDSEWETAAQFHSARRVFFLWPQRACNHQNEGECEIGRRVCVGGWVVFSFSHGASVYIVCVSLGHPAAEREESGPGMRSGVQTHPATTHTAPERERERKGGGKKCRDRSLFTLITTRSQKSWSWGIGSKLTTPENSRCCGPSSSWLLSFGNDLQESIRKLVI